MVGLFARPLPNQNMSRQKGGKINQAELSLGKTRLAGLWGDDTACSPD